MRLLACLAVLACAACQSMPAGSSSHDMSSSPDMIFGHCPEITPAAPSDTYHVMPGGLLDPCGLTTLPWIGVGMSLNGPGYGVATSANLVIHVQGDNGFSLDIDTTKSIDETGYAVKTTGPIHLSVSVPQAVMEYQDAPGSWRYVVTHGPQPVTFTSP